MNGAPISAAGKVEIVFYAPGFHTHGVAMSHRMVVLTSKAVRGTGFWVVMAPDNPSVIPPGVYLLFVVVNGVPSEGQWMRIWR